MDASGGDLRLQSGSPAIDTGNSALVAQDFSDLDADGDTTEPVPFDLAYNPRITGSAVDMGAYEALTYHLGNTICTLTYTAGEGGSISGLSPQNVPRGKNGTAVAAVANTGHHFVQWSDGSTANPRTDTNVTEDISVTASFAVTTYTVTPLPGANGSLSPSSPQTVSHGSTTSFTVAAATGFRPSLASGCGGTLSGNLFTTGPISEDCAVMAEFAANTNPVVNPAAAADSYDVDLGQTLTASAPGVLGNDSDPDGDSLSAALVSPPLHHSGGSFTLNSNGSFSHTHDGTNTGNDSFTYRAGDLWGGESAPVTVSLVLHTQSEADTDLTVSPSSWLFGVEELNNCASSASIPFTVKNSGTASHTIGVLDFDGTNEDEFSLGIDKCTRQTLSSGGTCTVEVKFCPKAVGSKSAALLIPSDDPETPVLTAFLHNHESLAEEAWRRLPPVLYSLSVPEEMIPGQTYRLTWSLLGYDESYQSYIVFFDCTGKVAGTCGESYGSHFAQSTARIPDLIEDGDWTYNGVRSKKFNYSYDFTVPLTRADTTPWPSGSTDIVVRFYGKDQPDADAGKGSLSLLIPGNLSPRYYDSEGRRLLKTIQNP